MKSNLIFLGVVCLLIDCVMATEWVEMAQNCFACINPLDANPSSYCINDGKCETPSDSGCSGAVGESLPHSCVSYSSNDPACDAISALVPTVTAKTNIITLPVGSYCFITLSGSSVRMKFTYTEATKQAVYYPTTSSFDSMTIRVTETTIDAAIFQVTEIKAILVNYDPENSVSFTIQTSDPLNPDPINGGSNGDPIDIWTGERDGKCLSCLNPHDTTKPTTDPVYWCTDTNTCETGATAPACTSITTVKECYTDAEKTVDSACEIINNLHLTKTPKVTEIILPSDSFCLITLIGDTATLKVIYSGLAGVYYPATEEWDSTTIKETDTIVGKISSTGRLLQGSDSGLIIAVVNYDASSKVFRIEGADPSVPDDDGGLSEGQIAGIIIGIVGLLAVISTISVWKAGYFNRFQKNQEKGAKYTQGETNTNATMKTDIETVSAR